MRMTGYSWDEDDIVGMRMTRYSWDEDDNWDEVTG